MLDPLLHLGFAQDEVRQCEAYADGRIVIPASIAGEPARLLLSTKQRLDVSLSLAYVRQRGFAYERRGESWGKSPLTEFESLGRSRPHEIVVVLGGDEDSQLYDTVGSLGTEYLDNAVLAIDPMDWRVGLSVRPEIRESYARAMYRLPLLAGILSNLPITTALGDPDANDVHPAFLVDTDRTRSVLSLEYAEHHWRGGARRRARKLSREGNAGKLDATWTLPDGGVVRLDMRVVERCAPTYVASIGVDRVDGYLGLDFLYQWMPAFDLTGRELVLFDFVGASEGSVE